ncbi:MAG: HEAT repeat domain-containing protein [Nannocystaceae bacterium]|nr:HEAT repeat domain-containing protein [Nannocystaceae bacterium]
MSSSLPAPYPTLVGMLNAPGWRERKEAVSKLREAVADDRDRGEVMAPLVEVLLDGLLSPDLLEGRAACHEVLVAMAPLSTAAVMARLERPRVPPRLLVDLLGALGDRSAVARCSALLNSPREDPNLRASAASALGRLGGAQASDALRNALRDGSQMLVVHVLDALHAMEAQVEIGALEHLFEDAFTRKPVALLLGYSRSPAALALLVRALEDPMGGVRAAAVLGLAKLGAGLDDERPGLVPAALARLSRDARANVRELVLHHDLTVCRAAIELATWARDVDAAGPVLEAMEDPLVHELAFGFVEAAGPTVGEVLREADAHSSEARPESLLRLLGAIDPAAIDEASLDLLAHGLSDSDETISQAAAEALARVGTRAALPELYRAMAEAGPRGEAAAEAMATVLRRGGDVAGTEVSMIVGTHWPDIGDLARNLCRVVGALGSPRYAARLVSMMGSADVGVRIAAALAVGQLEGEHEGVGALSFALADEEPQVRAAACRSLARAPAAVASLLSATSDDSPQVRTAAVQALVELDNPVALARLRAIIAEEPMPSVVVAAIAGLGNSALDQDLTMLMSLCTSADWEVVKAAARALTSFAAHRATAALLGLLGHGRWDIRWTAAEVLEQRGDATALASLRGALQREEDRLVRDVLGRAIERIEGLTS